MDELLCNEKHSQITKTLETHASMLNEHGGKIENLEKSDIGRSKDIDKLCDNLEGLNSRIDGIISQNRWFIGILVTGLVGFFFYAIEKGIF